MDQRALQLKEIPLFAFVEEEELTLMAEKLEKQSFKAGTTIIEPNSKSNGLFIVEKGSVKSFSINEEKNEVIFSYLAKDDSFAASALISGNNILPGFAAESNCELLFLSKSDFDEVISENPKITLTLTHLLSERLKNISLDKSTETIDIRYEGSIDATPFELLLKLVEACLFSGIVNLKKGDENVELNLNKGQVLSVLVNGKEKKETVLDDVLLWEKGSYEMIPKVKDNTVTKAQNVELDNLDDTVNLFERYLREKFTEFVQFAGSKVVQRALNRSYHNFENYFEAIKQIKIEVVPEIKIQLEIDGKWAEKHTLFIAVVLRDINSALDRDVTGMQFWTPRSVNDVYNTLLEKFQLFELYAQADELIPA